MLQPDIKSINRFKWKMKLWILLSVSIIIIIIPNCLFWVENFKLLLFKNFNVLFILKIISQMWFSESQILKVLTSHYLLWFSNQLCPALYSKIQFTNYVHLINHNSLSICSYPSWLMASYQWGFLCPACSFQKSSMQDSDELLQCLRSSFI